MAYHQLTQEQRYLITHHKRFGKNVREIAEALGPQLRADGLTIVGLDIIGECLTEVNVTSPTCARELDAQFGLNIAGMLFDRLERGASAR